MMLLRIMFLHPLTLLLTLLLPMFCDRVVSAVAGVPYIVCVHAIVGVPAVAGAPAVGTFLLLLTFLLLVILPGVPLLAVDY